MLAKTMQIAVRKTSTLSRIGRRRQIVISKSVFDAMQLKEADLLEITAKGGDVSMKTKKRADPDDTLKAEESKKVRHALTQMKAGKGEPWNQVKHELGL